METGPDGAINWIGIDISRSEIVTEKDAYLTLEALHKAAVMFKEQTGIVGYPILKADDLGQDNYGG